MCVSSNHLMQPKLLSLALMENLFPSTSFTTFALFISLLFLFITKWKKYNTADTKLQNLPPGPKQWPIIGHLHLFSSLPHRDLKEMAEKYGPLMRLKLGETSLIVASSPEVAKEILKTQDPTFAERTATMSSKIILYNQTDMVFSPYSDYWRQIRKICIMEFFSSKQVRSFASIRSDEALKLVTSVKSSAGKPTNITEKIFASTSSIIARIAFGKICKDKETLLKLLMEASHLSSGFEWADLFPSSKIVRLFSWNTIKMRAMRRKLDVILDEIIEEHKENLAKMSKEDKGSDSARRGNGEFGNEDIVDAFLRLMESGELDIPMNYDNIKAVVIDVFQGGTDTSSATVDWAMAELMRNPRVMAKAQAEVREMFKGRRENGIIDDTDLQKLKYLKLVIKEAMRLHIIIPLTPRACKKDSKVNGYFIPANSRVVVNAWAMARDPKYWTNPESFEPERFENNGLEYTGNHFEYLPFGSGKRMCPGMILGIADVELPLAQLLYNFDWKLPEGLNPHNLDMTETSGLTAKRKDDLYVIATPYDP